MSDFYFYVLLFNRQQKYIRLLISFNPECSKDEEIKEIYLYHRCGFNFYIIDSYYLLGNHPYLFKKKYCLLRCPKFIESHITFSKSQKHIREVTMYTTLCIVRIASEQKRLPWVGSKQKNVNTHERTAASPFAI